MAKNFFFNLVKKNITKTREGKDMVKRDFIFILLKLSFFLRHLLKKSRHSLFGAWSCLFVHIWFTHSEESKGFVNCFFSRNHTIRVGPWKIIILHNLTSWSMVYIGPYLQKVSS